MSAALLLVAAMVAAPAGAATPQATSRPAPGLAFESLATLDVGRAPHQIAFSTDGATAAVAVAGSDELVLVDTASLAIDARIAVAGAPLAARWLHGDEALLTTRFRTGGVLRVSRDGAAEREWPTAAGPSFAVGPLPDGTYLIAVEQTGELLVVHPDRDEPVARYEVGARPFPPGVTSDGRLAFVPAHDDGAVTVVDLWNRKVVATTDVGERPTVAAVLPGDVDCAVAVRGEDALVFLNTASFEVVGELRDVAAEPFALALAPDARAAFVSSTADHEVLALALPERRVVARVPTGEVPIAVGVHPSGASLWVACEGAHTLEVFRIPQALRARPAPTGDAITEVGVLGMIHGDHLTSERWGLAQVREAVLAFAPDAVLTEIPPNRWPRIARDWRERRAIEDERVRRFPEYVDVLLPLWEELGCAIEPCAAWSSEMAELRRARIAAFEHEPEHAAYREAQAAVAELLAAEDDDDDDPHFIHSARYDRRTKTELGPYDRFLNDWIGPGGWTHVNAAHMALVNAAIDRHRGRRLLVTFGAGHKYWFLEKLRERDDVRLVDMTPHLPEPGREPPIAARVRAEVHGLHRFFEHWFNAELEDTAEAYARFTDVLAPGFEITNTDGATRTRAPLLEELRAAHGRFAARPIRIWIERVRVAEDAPNRYRVTYEEWQAIDGVSRGRASDALLIEAVNTPNGLAWESVRETWLE